jgi:hypothetical protein
VTRGQIWLSSRSSPSITRAVADCARYDNLRRTN